VIRRALLLGASLLLAAPASAAPLTLEQALARADEVSIAVRRQQLSGEAAEARWQADPRAGAPSIRVGVRDLDVRTDLHPIARDPEVVARLRFPFPRPWELANAAQQGRATIAREAAELESIREDVRLEVTARFHAIPLLRESVATAARLTELRATHLSLVERRRVEGLATALDWLESEEELRDADERRAELDADLAAAEAELRALLELSPDDPLELAPDDLGPLIEGAVPARGELEAGLSDRDPDVREAEAEVARAEARLRRTRLGGLPWLDWAEGGAVFSPDRPVAFEVGVALDVPIYLWSPARTRVAFEDLSAARLEREEVERAAELRLARHVRSAAAARERWRVETEHRDAIAAQTAPLMELADPVLRTELAGRVARAELRVRGAFIDLVEEADRLDDAAHR
jgi:outer membrane protein TolC